jgi:hypothetical protein
VVFVEKYSLLGTYDNGQRNNIEIIATSDEYSELVDIRDSIKAVNEQLSEQERDVSDPEVNKIIENHLAAIDIVEEITGYIHDISVLGIFELKQVQPDVIKICGKCGKTLFEGTEKESKGLIIYCAECEPK